MQFRHTNLNRGGERVENNSETYFQTSSPPTAHQKGDNTQTTRNISYFPSSIPDRNCDDRLSNTLNSGSYLITEGNQEPYGGSKNDLLKNSVSANYHQSTGDCGKASKSPKK